MIRKALSVLLLLCSLFSGQLMANANGHDFYQAPGADHWMRHNADSDEIRARSKDAADELREDHHTINARKPNVIHL